MPVNFEEVKKNAAEQGLDLGRIAIQYEGLTDQEMLDLSARRLGRAAGRPGAWLGTFTEDGEALFPTKAVAVISLEA
jgi:hypothetical protein